MFAGRIRDCWVELIWRVIYHKDNCRLDFPRYSPTSTAFMLHSLGGKCTPAHFLPISQIWCQNCYLLGLNSI